MGILRHLTSHSSLSRSPPPAGGHPCHSTPSLTPGRPTRSFLSLSTPLSLGRPKAVARPSRLREAPSKVFAPWWTSRSSTRTCRPSCAGPSRARRFSSARHQLRTRSTGSRRSTAASISRRVSGETRSSAGLSTRCACFTVISWALAYLRVTPRLRPEACFEPPPACSCPPTPKSERPATRPFPVPHPRASSPPGRSGRCPRQPRRRARAALGVPSGSRPQGADESSTSETHAELD